MQTHPKWKYHPQLPARIVPDVEAEELLGPGWYDHPDQAVIAASVTVEKQEVAASDAIPAVGPARRKRSK